MSQNDAVEMSDTDDPHPLPPLTRNNYQRSIATEADIRSVHGLSGQGLAAAFAERRVGHAGYRGTEALIHVIRREKQGDRRTAAALNAHLITRCQIFLDRFGRNLEHQEREDIQSDVFLKLATVLGREDDSADYLECFFGDYVKKRALSALAVIIARKRRERDDEVAIQSDEGEAHAQELVDGKLSPEEMATLKHALATLPEDLRELAILHHILGWPVGNDRDPNVRADKLTLAGRYDIEPRSVRKRLTKITELLTRTRKDLP